MPDVQRMVVLDAGQIVYDGPPRSVLARDLALLGLTLPSVVRVAAAAGLSEIPLTVEEFLNALDPDGASQVACELRVPSPHQASGGQFLLQAEGIWFSFDGTPVLRGAGLGLEAGECLALVGNNGSGKTTLI